MHLKSLSSSLLACVLPAILAEITEESAYQYLQQFGHIHSNTPETPTQRYSEDISDYDHNFQQELMDFQSFAGLPQTGILDLATEDVIQSPRCGVKDYPSVQSQSNQQGTPVRLGKWEKKKLTYRVVKYSTKVDNTDVDETCRKAMDLWEKAADITFEHMPSGNVDIEILFDKRDHGDRNFNGEFDERCGTNFDGPGRVLAHALYPPPLVYPACPKGIAGDIHIDDEEDWSVTHNEGKDLLHTIAHEVGHSLGLDHSKGFKKDKKSPIMQPYHPGWVQNLTLHQDDKERIQKLYGISSEPASATTQSPTGWSAWGLFSQCSRTCGQGKKTRHRTCTGTSCTHTQQIQERLCNLTPCQEQNHNGHIGSIEPGFQHDAKNSKWGEDQWCNSGSWATGIDLKIHKDSDYFIAHDDNALNAIKLICSGQGGQSNITSLQGSHGEWRGAKRCANGYITGVSLRSEKYQGKFKDDTAANGVRATCEDGEEIKSTNFEGYWGTWSGLEQCPRGTAICGIRTKVELSCGWCTMDNVALTRAEFHCCSKQ